jgi:hypothetical protein
MSHLRTSLEAARREYRSIRYPGDLATEMFDSPRSRHARLAGWIWTAAAVAATAAAVTLIVLLPETPHRDDLGTLIEPTPDTFQLSLGAIPPISMPQLPADLELMPAAQDISFATPSFSFVVDQDAENNSTTQEAV